MQAGSLHHNSASIVKLILIHYTSFRTEGEWQRKLSSSPRRSAEILARELKEALESGE
jgi:hypothetical protein